MIVQIGVQIDVQKCYGCKMYPTQRVCGWSDRQILTHEISTWSRNRIKQLCGRGVCAWATQTKSQFKKHKNAIYTCKMNEERAVDAIQRALLSPYLFERRNKKKTHCTDAVKWFTKATHNCHMPCIKKKPMQIFKRLSISTCSHSQIVAAKLLDLNNVNIDITPQIFEISFAHFVWT